MGNNYMSYVNSSFVTLGTGPVTVTLDEVTDVDWDLDANEEMWDADGSFFPKLIVVRRSRRNVKVSGGDISKLLALIGKGPGTFTTTLAHAVNGTGAGSGALTFTLTPCIPKAAPHKGPSGKFSTGDVILMGYAPDGVLDPLSYVPL